MLGLFVRRPVLASVIAIVISLLGALALARLPMTLFPDIAPPAVNVTVHYNGANAETVLKAAVVPLERAINGVPHMKYMQSDANNDGTGVISIIFESGSDPELAAVNVQNRVNMVLDELPPEVLKGGVAIEKEEHAMLAFVSIYSTDTALDERFLYNFTDINVIAELKRINGVGFAEIAGAKEYAMRVWIEPSKLAAYDLAIDDVTDALDDFNLEAAPGTIGENSDAGTTPLQYTLVYAGKLRTPEAYAAIPIRSTADGKLVHLGDVARVELGATAFDVESKFNGHPSASIELKQRPGSNARDVIAQLKAKLDVIQAEQFLPGMKYELSFDVSRFLDASVHEVLKTLLEAFVLVTLVVFLFLRDFRSTLIPILAVPVSLVGTLAVIERLGFSLNLITLFALVLSIGIVVDNAIVVVEAVHHKITHEHLTPRIATERAIAELGPAIVAMTLVMVSVFLPISAVPGPAGVFYRQFGLTTAVAITLSGVVALTLTPALCATLLRAQKQTHSRFDAAFAKLENAYARLARRCARPSVIALATLAFLVAGGVVAKSVPQGFIPEEDQGTFNVSIRTPPGATLERTKEVVDAVAKAGRDLPGIESIATLAGQNILTDGTAASYGTCLVNLVPWDKREVSVADVIAALRERTANIQDASIEFFAPPPVPGYGNAGGFELRLLDRTGRGDLAEMDKVIEQFIADLKTQPSIANAFTGFEAGYPQYIVKLDSDKAAQMGVTARGALQTMQTMLGSKYAANFIRFGQMYKVMVQLPPQERARPEQVLELRIRNDRGEYVPLSAFMSLHKTYGADALTRYNMYPSAEISGDAKPGASSHAVLEEIQKTAKAKLPRGFAIDWAGISRDEVAAGNEGLIVAIIALVFVWLVLAAQYESFVLPGAVIFALPPGLLGAFAMLSATGLQNNIYAHIALVVLIGLLGKNAILIVEYAELRAAEGMAPLEAAVEGAKLRLRPILMTSLAFVAGLIPLAIASGAGAVANRTVGSAAVGGMIAGTIVGVLLVPGLYVICKRFSKRGRS